MAKESDKRGTTRRGFFGAAVGAASAGILTAGATPAAAQESPDERVKARYQETDHVKKFYESNRYYKKGA